jgi:hypothetical protein
MKPKTENCDEPKRAKYKKPGLTGYGSIAQLTLTASGKFSDNNQNNCNHNQNDAQAGIPCS